MIILDATDETLELLTSAAVSTDVYVSYADITTTTLVAGAQDANISTATTTTILAAPAASTQRQAKLITVRNRGASSNTITLKFDKAATERLLTGEIVLGAGETMTYTPNGGFVVRDSAGRERKANVEHAANAGYTFPYLTQGTAIEAAGRYYGFAKDGGVPGPWVPGAPGLNGWWTDAGTATNAANPAGASQTGSPLMPDAVVGSLFLMPPAISSFVAAQIEIFDILWYNTGIVPTTTTAQNITMPAGSIPARDNTGTTDGEGWAVGIYVTTATTNAGAITNMTCSYTNSVGVAGRTATVFSFPATAVVGTVDTFNLQAGDRGVRSIQSVTLGTSLGGAGAVSLFLYRKIGYAGCNAPNLITVPLNQTGVKIYNGTAIWVVGRFPATSATSLAGQLQVQDR